MTSPAAYSALSGLREQIAEMRRENAEMRRQLAAIREQLERVEKETIACRRHREGQCGTKE